MYIRYRYLINKESYNDLNGGSNDILKYLLGKKKTLLSEDNQKKYKDYGKQYMGVKLGLTETSNIFMININYKKLL